MRNYDKFPYYQNTGPIYIAKILSQYFLHAPSSASGLCEFFFVNLRNVSPKAEEGNGRQCRAHNAENTYKTVT